MITSDLIIFRGKNVRRYWDAKKEKWYFSIVDIIEILSESKNPTDYLKKLRKRDKILGSFIGTNCPHVEMRGISRVLRKVLAGDTETVLRIIQSIPSKNAEPFKIWLAKVGNERLQDISDPERSLNRARDYWQRMGRSEKWIQQRMMGQETRNKLTDYWQTHKVTKQEEYAILTNIIHEEWSDLTVKDHKKLKSLKSQNLRDHMTEAELIFSALAEFSTRQIAEKLNSTGFAENKLPAQKGGRVAKIARNELEKKTGKSIISGNNYFPIRKKIK
jgi:hypothetical protein